MRGSGGGSATAGGMDFQHRVTAWVATHILAEKDATAPWELSAGTTLEWLRCETGLPVDDLLVGTSAKGLVFAQIKRSLQLSADTESDLASSLDQFVLQFVTSRGKTGGNQPWDRPLDPERDRLVLITSPTSSEPVRANLRSVLEKLRHLPADQPLDNAAANAVDRRVLSIMRSHLTRSWRKASGSDHSDTELKQLLSLVHVQVLAVDDGGTDESNVQDLLRQAVLKDPDQAQAAWPLLITLCAVFAAKRSGSNRSSLQHELLSAGIPLQVPRGYKEDIERLRKYSQSTFDSLAYLACIRVGPAIIKIRRACTEALLQAAAKNSILVVGEPGAGKSGVLHDFVESLQKEGQDWVFLSVDRLDAQSLGMLREAVGLDNEVSEVLANWPGIQPGFLIIDALDAARGERAQKIAQDLIRDITKDVRWRVVASIRKYDLRYGLEIKELFEGVPDTEFQDSEFKNVRHLNVPRLSEEELNQLASQSSELHELISHAPTELHDLLQILFNLRLIGDLLGAGARREELSPIRTQLGLLNRYWSHRVVRSDGLGDARESILRSVCEKMVADRALRIDRSDVARPETSTLLDDLLSTQVLTEWQPMPDATPDRYILAFSHNVLFDFVAARLLLRGTHEGLVLRLVHDPDLVVMIQPSLLLHFHHLWTVDSSHSQFWDLVFRIVQVSQIPEIGKLIGPSVAAEVTRDLTDLELLYTSLIDSSSANHTSAEHALRHIFGALLAGARAETPLIGPSAGPWCQLLERISRSLRLPVAYTVRSLLGTMCERPEEFTADQRIMAGHTSRRLLEFAWAQERRDGWLIIHSLQCVCRTYQSDPVASAALIRRCLDPAHFSQYGFEELPWLAREVKALIGIDPTLCGEIYSVAFSFPETSTEPTRMGPSLILPLVSNRRQDYEMALYELAEVFPTFLEHAPEYATHALVSVIEAYVAQHHSDSPSKEPEETFGFGGRQARLRADYSQIWDEGDTYRHAEPIEMLDAFQQYLEKTAEQPEGIEIIRDIVNLLVSENRLAALWRRVLRVAARFPITLGKEILPFTWSIPVLTCYDTTILVGEFLKAIFLTLSPDDRERIERAILSIPKAAITMGPEEGEQVRNRLLGCLTNIELVTEEGRRALEGLKASKAIPPNEPEERLIAWRPSYDEGEHLRGQGVPVDAEANRKIRDLERPVREFVDRHLNSAPSLEEYSGVYESLQSLHNALCNADEDGVHPKQRDSGWGTLADACARIVACDRFSCEESADLFVKTVLLTASHNPEPVYSPELDAQFDDHISWGPAARIEAARGLITLAYKPICATTEVMEAIERLSNDPVPATRFQIAHDLTALFTSAPDLMWRLIERGGREEASRGVLQGLLGGPLKRLAGRYPDRIVNLTKIVFDRVREGPGAQEVQEFCVGIFASLYIWKNQSQCGEVVLNIATNPASYADEALHLLAHLREPLTHGPTHLPDTVQDAIRHRALDLVDRMLRSARDALQRIERSHSEVPYSNWPQQDQKSAESLVQLIYHLGSNVYFASGAHSTKGERQAEENPQPTREKAERFYREARPILDELADVGIPRIAHHLLETLEFLIQFDPHGVFLCIGRVVRASQQAGYQYESLAADLIVRIVERYIAEYRTLLREDLECRRTLIEILDLFVQAGWPSARLLTYRTWEIFR